MDLWLFYELQQNKKNDFVIHRFCVFDPGFCFSQLIRTVLIVYFTLTV